MARYSRMFLDEKDVLRENKEKCFKNISLGSAVLKQRNPSVKLDQEMTKRIFTEAKQIAKVCAEISSRTGPVNQARWDRPDKKVRMGKFLDISAQEIAQYSYLPAMEHTFDMLNVYLRLLVNYLHQIPAVNEYFSPSNIVRPTESSLALRTLACMLWSRIQFIHEIIIKSKNEWDGLTENGVRNVTTQTESICLSFCENCHNSKQLIKKLAETVEFICKKYDFDCTNVMDLRTEMAEDVFFVSQWAATTRWCDAIAKDFQLLSDLAYNSVEKSIKLNDENSILKKDFYEKLIEIDREKNNKLEEMEKKQKLLRETAAEEANNLNKRLEDSEKIIINTRKEVQEERMKLLNFKEKWANLSRDLNTKKLEIENLETEMKTLKEESEKKIFDYRDEIGLKDFTIDSLNKRLKELEEKIECYEKEEVSLKEKFETQQKHETILWKNYNTLQEENQKLKQNIKPIIECTDAFMQHTQPLKPQISFTSVLRATITGNPLKDMQAQKLLNDSQILALQEENKDLTKTILRLYAQNSMFEAMSESS